MIRLLALYQAGTTALGPLVALYLGRRMARGKEDRDRFSERQGFASRARPPGRSRRLSPYARLCTRASRAAMAASRSTNSRARSTTGTSIILPSTVTAPTPSVSALS